MAQDNVLEGKKEPEKMVIKTISGDINAINANGLALVFEKNEATGSESEMWFPFPEKVDLEGYKAKKNILLGDKIRVTFEETKDGSQRIMKKIQLVRNRTPSEAEEFESVPLKVRKVKAAYGMEQNEKETAETA